jgi:uncharacterized protein (TIGR00156 family)
MKRTTKFACAIALITCTVSALAQVTGYTGPSTGGPKERATTAPVLTAKQMLDTGVDDQYATLKGKLIRHTGGKHYDFADQSGQIRVEISPKHFPSNQAIDANTTVELVGKFDKKRFNTSEFEVKQVRVASQ